MELHFNIGFGGSPWHFSDTVLKPHRSAKKQGGVIELLFELISKKDKLPKQIIYHSTLILFPINKGS